MIRNVKLSDAASIAAIYNYYVENTIITFDETTLTVLEMESKINSTIKKHPWFVYEENNTVLGYAYASDFRVKCAYRNTLESTIYLHHETKGKGIGKKLYQHLFNELKSRGIHTVIGGLSVPNDESVRLHQQFGFEKVAHFKQVGFKFNKWIDVEFWQLML